MDLIQITGLLFFPWDDFVSKPKTKVKRELYRQGKKELSNPESAPGPNYTAPLLTRITSADTRISAAVTRRSTLGEQRRRSGRPNRG